MGSSSTKEPTRVIAVMPDMIPAHIGTPVVPDPSFYEHYTGPALPSSPTTSPPAHHEREPIPRTMRNFVWVEYHGENNIGACYCCGAQIGRYHAGWHCAHVVAEAKGGETRVENLRPCCRHCNLSMGDQNLYAYIKEKGLKGRGAKDVDQYLRLHSSQVGDRRDNNWGKPAKPAKAVKAKQRQQSGRQRPPGKHWPPRK
jgi:hypothetical protein